MSSLEKAWDLESQRIFIRTPDDAGRVLSFADGVATVSGLYDVRIGEKLIFEDSYNHAVDEEGPMNPKYSELWRTLMSFPLSVLSLGRSVL
jgi:hypothetical protein